MKTPSSSNIVCPWCGRGDSDLVPEQSIQLVACATCRQQLDPEVLAALDDGAIASENVSVPAAPRATRVTP